MEIPEKQYVETLKRLNLGYQGEKNARELVFDVSTWVEKYGPGEVKLLHRRPDEKMPYPAVTHRESNLIYWPLSPADTAYSGLGEVQLLYFVGNVLVKSICCPTNIMPSLMDPGPVPDWQPQLLEQLTRQAARAEAAIQTTTTAEKQAFSSAEKAQASANQTEQDRQAITQIGNQVRKDATAVHQTAATFSQQADHATQQATAAIRQAGTAEREALAAAKTDAIHAVAASGKDAEAQIIQACDAIRASVTADRQAAQVAAQDAARQKSTVDAATTQVSENTQAAQLAAEGAESDAAQAAGAASQAKQAQQEAQKFAKNAFASADRAEAEANRSIALGLTACQIGDTVRVQSVDEQGQPTSWAPLPSEKWISVETIHVTKPTKVVLRDTWPDNKTAYNFQRIIIKIKTGVGSTAGNITIRSNSERTVATLVDAIDTNPRYARLWADLVSNELRVVYTVPTSLEFANRPLNTNGYSDPNNYLCPINRIKIIGDTEPIPADSIIEIKAVTI